MSAQEPRGSAFSRERRRSPLWGQLGLAIGFLLLVIVAVFTVLLPELRDDAEDDAEEGPQPQHQVEEASSSSP